MHGEVASGGKQVEDDDWQSLGMMTMFGRVALDRVRQECRQKASLMGIRLMPASFNFDILESFGLRFCWLDGRFHPLIYGF